MSRLRRGDGRTGVKKATEIAVIKAVQTKLLADGLWAEGRLVSEAVKAALA